VQDTFNIPLHTLNLLKLTKSEQAVEKERILKTEVETPFNLSDGPLLRATLLQLDEQEHLIVFSMHHIITDGWSMNILLQELAAQYSARLRNEESALPPLPVQYTDYAVWQREMLRGERKEMLLSYWRQQLANLPTLSLPTDFTRTEPQSLEGGRKRFA
jgi:hypothetical protein